MALVIIALLFYASHASDIKKVISRFYKNKRLHLIFIALIAIFAIIIPRLQASSLFFTEEGGGTLRFMMIQQGVYLLQLAPWTGFGAGTGVRVFLDNYPNGYASTFPFPIHLAYLQLALESGIPATIAFFAPFYFIIRKSIDTLQKSSTNSLLLSPIYCAIIILVYFIFQPTYGRIEFIFIGLVLGCATAQLMNIAQHQYEH